MSAKTMLEDKGKNHLARKRRYTREIILTVCVFARFKTEEEAVQMANGTKYGLAGNHPPV